MAGLRAKLASALRAAYTRLPISWNLRLKIKHWLFVALGPLLRRTDAYRRWQTMGTGARRMPARERPAETSKVLERYVANSLDEARGADAASYVGLPAGLEPPDTVAAKAIAFYLPQFHPIPENDAWWGRGFTEWTNVSKARPQFLGHYQPQLPGELGFYDLRLGEVMRRQIELARLYGLHGFCFYYYWFAGRRLLEKPLDDYLASDGDFPFCLCWANENWTRRWDGAEHEVLVGQKYDDDNDDAFIRDLLPYLRDRRYIRIDGRPLVVVYRPSKLPDCRRTLQHWRQVCRESGVGEIFLAMVQYDVTDPAEFGFDAALEFPPHKLASGLTQINDTLEIVNPDYAGYVIDYEHVVQRAASTPAPAYPLFRGVFPGWDNEARRPGRGYTFVNSTPSAYSRWLREAVDFAVRKPVAGEPMVFINAWNEWAEGAHLEPDRKYGYAFLQATRDVLTRAPVSRLLLVVHDAHPHGAQSLALNLLRELRTGLGLDVEVLLLGPGPLLEDFRRLAPVHECLTDSGAELDRIAGELRASGRTLALVNSVASGRAVAPLRRAGFELVSLVHEMPELIRDYGLVPALTDMLGQSRAVVVPSLAVLEGVRSFVPAAAGGVAPQLLPQGLFKRNRHRWDGDPASARRLLRQRLGLAADARIVLAVGYADRRKGVDLLVDAVLIAAREEPLLHLVWVGHHDAEIVAEAERRWTSAGLADRFHFVGMDFDSDDYYAGADVYALASREDPFPSVVLESLSVSVPVVAFAGTGGGADLVARGAGRLVPAFDVQAYAEALLELLRDRARRDALGARGREIVDAEFSFRRYAIDLLRLGGLDAPRVSVIVPNFNYAGYLAQRLEGIAEQTLRPYEIIVLDDASGDDSPEVIAGICKRLEPEPRVVVNERNSGSVFRQWLRGVELARGDYVWIAEADDLSSPEFLQRLVALLAQDERMVMAYCQSRPIDREGASLGEDYLAWTDDVSTRKWKSAYVAEGADEAAQALCIKNTIPNVSAVLFRREPLFAVLREHIEQIAGYRVAGDWITYLRLLRGGRIGFEPRSLNRHRRHEASVTSASDQAGHYREVLAAQGLAAELYRLGPDALAGAADYAGRLARQFGLDPMERRA